MGIPTLGYPDINDPATMDLAWQSITVATRDQLPLAQAASYIFRLKGLSVPVLVESQCRKLCEGSRYSLAEIIHVFMREYFYYES